MNKKYKLIFINNQTQANYSIAINWLLGYSLFIFVLLIFLFTAFGVFRFIKPHAHQQEINNLFSEKKDIENIINTLKEKNIIDSTMINKQLSLIPNNPPVKGIVTRGVVSSISSAHNGIDIATKSNEKVKASQQGMVIFSNSFGDYGNTIIVAHPNNYYSVYSHLNRIVVKERKYVNANEVIGYVGQTGNSNAPHLHFEIWKNHHIIDPRNLIKEYKIKDVSIE